VRIEKHIASYNVRLNTRGGAAQSNVSLAYAAKARAGRLKYTFRPIKNSSGPGLHANQTVVSTTQLCFFIEMVEMMDSFSAPSKDASLTVNGTKL